MRICNLEQKIFGSSPVRRFLKLLLHLKHDAAILIGDRVRDVMAFVGTLLATGSNCKSTQKFSRFVIDLVGSPDPLKAEFGSFCCEGNEDTENILFHRGPAAGE